MKNKVQKNKEMTVGVALVSLFVGIAIFVPKILNEETEQPPERETRQEETVPLVDAMDWYA